MCCQLLILLVLQCSPRCHKINVIFGVSWGRSTQFLSNSQSSGLLNWMSGWLRLKPSSTFVISGVTADNTKYHYVLSALEQETATCLLDLINAPPPHMKYTALKERLIGTFSLTNWERALRLLHIWPLGDSRSSHLMDKMLNVAFLGVHPPVCCLNSSFWSDYLKTVGFNWYMPK